MRTFLYLCLMALGIWACSTNKNATATSAKLARDMQDSTEYEVIIYDIHFDNWYLLNYSEAKDHSDAYYHSKNMVAASRWDDYYRSGKFINIVDSFINYQPQTDYGIEVNRKLFWYFTFVEEYYKIHLFD